MEMSRRQEQRVMQGPRAGSSSAGEVRRAAKGRSFCWLVLLVGLVIPLAGARAHVHTGTDAPHALNWLAGVDDPAGWQMIAEYNGAGSLQRKYVYGPGIDEPVRMTSGSNRFYYHPDGLGSVTEITATNGVRRESYTYDVYGTPTLYGSNGVVIATSQISNRLLFTGRDRDPDTTLYNYRYRYCSPSLGRFVQVDPRRTADGELNLYRYAFNDPVNYLDPDGQAAETVVDVVSIGWSVVDLVRNPSWVNAGYLGWDVAATAIPFIPGSYVAKGTKLLGKSAKCGEAAKSGKYVEDFATKATKNWSAAFKSQGEARALARTKLGSNPIEIEPGKWRSADGKWQYRAKPGDVADRHIHLEELNPQTGEVIQNVHLRWPAGGGG